MNRSNQMGGAHVLVACAVMFLAVMMSPVCFAEDRASSQSELAGAILDATGVKGGLVVQVGCRDGRLAVALRANDSYLVQALDSDPAKVAEARKQIRELGVYGPVSVDTFDGKHLPYAENLVNLIVMEDPDAVAPEELLRALAPGGVAYVNAAAKWTKTVKPRPAEIDEWTHFLCDASNNAVSDDSVVGPPHHLQWEGGPKWARSHDHLATVSAVVSSGGRVFSIVDEGPIAAVILQPKWSLVARDAFSGVILWERVISDWQWHLRGFRSGPSDLSRRLVAVGDRVYVTLGIDGPLCALDAATGETITTYANTEATLEVVCQEGTLYVVAGDAATQRAVAKAKRRGVAPGLTEVRPQSPEYLEQPPVKRLMAIDAATGRLHWQKADADTAELMPTTLAVSRGRTYFQNADNLFCLDARSGTEVWRAARPTSRSRPTWSAPTLVVYGDVVLSADRAVADEKIFEAGDERAVEWFVSSKGGQAPVGEMIAYSAATGERLWSAPCQECYNAPVDVLVADGLVWSGNLVRASEPGITQGLDVKTGEVKRTRPVDKEFFVPGMGHHRCYRNKATCRYLVLGRSGVEFIDLKTGVPVPNHWTRGTCQYGVMPCNGLLYVPPHTCACFPTAKLNGFNCLAPRRQDQAPEMKVEDRLEKGPAYGLDPSPQPLVSTSSDWPTYRCDVARSGRSTSAVPLQSKPSWRVDLGGNLSSVTVADGKLFVAQIDIHTVHALDAENGRAVWSYTTGGRVDSPPTIWQGHVLFGSADGWVYCLRVSDGRLAWRFHAAPEDRHIVSYGQVESAWPVPGSVLVKDGVACCAAGRSSYLDGGIWLCRLDAKTGRKLSETRIDHRDPATGYQRKGVVQGTNMPGALSDVLSCDGQSLFLRQMRFDLSGQPQEDDVTHLYAPAGFLDDSWWHRTYWQYGTSMSGGYGGWPISGSRVPAGRLLVLDESKIYGFGRSQYIHHGAHIGIDGMTVFHFKPESDADRRFTYYQAFAIARPTAEAAELAAESMAKRGRQSGAPPKVCDWTETLPVLARAMVLADDTLILAGPPDLLASDDPIGALEGSQGGVLMAVSTTDGRILTEQPLDAPPVLDGLAAAYGRLYMARTDGTVICFKAR